MHRLSTLATEAVDTDVDSPVAADTFVVDRPEGPLLGGWRLSRLWNWPHRPPSLTIDRMPDTFSSFCCGEGGGMDDWVGELGTEEKEEEEEEEDDTTLMLRWGEERISVLSVGRGTTSANAFTNYENMRKCEKEEIGVPSGLAQGSAALRGSCLRSVSRSFVSVDKISSNDGRFVPS
jgi:hypothetical protein